MKVTLSDVGSLTNETSALSTINTNSNSIENAMEKTLSRDGTAPNEMEAPLDMNGQQIINLPAPGTPHSPLRLQDLADFIGEGEIIINSGISPEDFGAVGDGIADDTAAFVAMGAHINANPVGVVINHAAGATYKVWPAGTTPISLLNLSNVNGLVWNWNGSTMTTDNSFAAGGFGVSIWAHCQNVRIYGANFTWTTSGGAPSTLIGPLLFAVQEFSAPWSQNFLIKNSVMDGGLGFLRVLGDVSSSTTSTGGFAQNFAVINADINNCHFPLNFQGSGDNFFGRGIHVRQSGRAYFPWNVSNHDVEMLSNGTTANSVLIKNYPYPNMSDRKRSTSNIKLNYKVVGQPTALTGLGGQVCFFQFEQPVPSVTVSNAANNGSGKVRLTVNSTANMLTGQSWYFNAIGGTTEANGEQVVTVINATTVDLTSVTFVNAYTSGGTGAVPAAIRDVDVHIDLPSDGATGYQMLGMSKMNSSGVVDPVVCGYEMSNITISGRHKGYNRVDIPVIDLFPTTNGQWNNEIIHNFNLKNIKITGTQGTAAVVVPTGALINIEDFHSNLNLTLTSPTTGLRMRNVNTPNVRVGASAGWANALPTSNTFQLIDTALPSAVILGQSGGNAMSMFWRYNATASLATAELATFGYLNPMSIDASTLTINDNSNGTTDIHNGGAAPTGTGAYVRATSPALVTPALGTPSAVVLTNGTGLPISTGLTGAGTGVLAALAVNVGSAGAPVLFNGALGTPSSGTVTNLTGTASININGTVGATTPNTVSATQIAASNGIFNSSSVSSIGYTTGAGSTVTQTTSRATGVTLNTTAGQITTDTTALASGAFASFTVTNSRVTANDTILVNLKSGIAATSITYQIDAVAAGSFVITYRNNTAGNITAAIVFQFAVFRGAIS